MDCRAVVSAREELHPVADVDDERVRDVLDEAPLVVGREDLQGGDGLGVEDGDGAEVGVAFEPDVVRELFFFLGARVATRRLVGMQGERGDGWAGATDYFMKRTKGGNKRGERSK